MPEPIQPQEEDISPALEQFREQMRVQAKYYAENDKLRCENARLRRQITNQVDMIQKLQRQLDARGES